MPYKITRNDITTMATDAIVNFAEVSVKNNVSMNDIIKKMGGNEFISRSIDFENLSFGEAVFTPGYNLSSKYVIHTKIPNYESIIHNDEEYCLRTNYRNVLLLALELKCDTVAIPLISTVSDNLSKRSLIIAQEEIQDFLLSNEMSIYIVVYDNEPFVISKECREAVSDYVATNTEIKFTEYYMTNEIDDDRGTKSTDHEHMDETIIHSFDTNRFNIIDDGFSKTLLKLIDQTGESDATIYKKANIDRKHFNKIKNSEKYQPSKSTVCAFAIALKLNLDETNDLLRRAGYALSKSFLFDLIIEYALERRLYDVHKVNEILFYHNQTTLGMQ